VIAQLPATSRRQPVEARAAIVVGDAPIGVEQALLFETIQRGIERALLDGEGTFGNLLDAQQYAVSV